MAEQEQREAQEELERAELTRQQEFPGVNMWQHQQTAEKEAMFQETIQKTARSWGEMRRAADERQQKETKRRQNEAWLKRQFEMRETELRDSFDELHMNDTARSRSNFRGRGGSDYRGKRGGLRRKGPHGWGGRSRK
jgi:hypothetical protein